MKTYVVGTHQKCLTKALLMSTHNMFSVRKKKKYLPKTILSTSMLYCYGAKDLMKCGGTIKLACLVLILGKYFLVLHNVGTR